MKHLRQIFGNKSILIGFGVAALIMVLIAGSIRRVNQNHTRSEQLKRAPTKSFSQHSILQSSSQYLKENGIDCTLENTYSTHDSLAVDPQNPNIIYIGVEGRGVYKSEDTGRTWRKIIKGLVAYPDNKNKSELCFPDLSEIYIDPTNTKRLLLVTSDITTGYVDWPYGETGGIWESRDGGESWRQKIRGEVNVAGSGSISVDPKNPKIMYYPVNPDPPTFQEAPIKTSLNKKGSVYKTVDGGQTWQEIEMPMLPGLQAMAIFINPQDSNHLIFLTQSHDHVYGKNSIMEVFLYKQYGLLESFDAGRNWHTLGDNLPSPYRALFEGDVSKNNYKHIIVRPFLFGPDFPPETTVQKSFFSTDGGKTFEETSTYIWIGRFNPHDTQGNQLLGYTTSNLKIMESNDAGKSWTTVGTPPEVASGKVRVTNFVWEPQDENTVYMSGDYANVWQSTDGGKTWKNILTINQLPK